MLVLVTTVSQQQYSKTVMTNDNSPHVSRDTHAWYPEKNYILGKGIVGTLVNEQNLPVALYLNITETTLDPLITVFVEANTNEFDVDIIFGHLAVEFKRNGQLSSPDLTPLDFLCRYLK